MSSHTMWQVNKARHGELLEVAKSQQLVKHNQAIKFGRKERLIVNVGDLLVAAGQRVKARYEPMTR
jgi:hypothetical protein